jgi:hypothetical protein
VHGVAVLASYEGLSFSLFRRLVELVPIRSRVQFQNGCFAARHGPLLLFHVPRFLRAVLALLRPLLRASIAARLRFCGADLSSAAALVADVSLLPPAFGGTGAPLGSPADTAWLEHHIRLEALGF